MSTTLGPGSIVRWKGVSPECSVPHETRHGFALYGIGTFIEMGAHYAGYAADHNLMVEVYIGIYCLVRPDEVEVIDEWGEAGDVDAQRFTEANVAGAVSVGV